MFIIPFLLLLNFLPAYADSGSRMVNGTPVHFKDIVFPMGWLSDPRSICTPFDSSKESATTQLVAGLERAMSKYPPQLLRDHLGAVNICQHLSFATYNYGGTYHREAKALYLSGQQLENSSPTDIAGTFHHEFSSLLLLNFEALFPRQTWVDVNAEGLKSYLTGWTGGADAFKGHISHTPSESFLLRGFVVPYGTSNFENDFNTYVQWMLSEPATVLYWARRYPRVCLKARMAARFLSALNIAVAPDFIQDGVLVCP